MELKPVLHRITIYPVKSLDGMDLQKAVISEGSCLLHDREFAMVDSEGKFINGKSNQLVHSLRSKVDFENGSISFRHIYETSWIDFHLDKERQEIQSFLSDYFGKQVLLLQNKTGQFMDIPRISGATILSTSSLHEVSSWFDNMDLSETRRRFRATLEIGNVPPFWEDHLFSKESQVVEFKVGDVSFFGMSPRARCVVPSRNPETGEVIHAFQKTFAGYRASTLPEWGNLEGFGHSYYLTVNCYIPETEIGKVIETGNEIKIIGDKLFQ